MIHDANNIVWWSLLIASPGSRSIASIACETDGSYGATVGAAWPGGAPRPRHEAGAIRAIRIPLGVVGSGARRGARGIGVGLVIRGLAVRQLRVDSLLSPVAPGRIRA